MFQNKYNYLLYLLLFLLPCIGNAKSMPVHLSADSISYHDKSHTSEYHKNVNVTYGNSEFLGIYMLVKHGKKNALEKLTISGNPVKFHIHRKPQQSQIQGYANSIILFPERHQAILVGDAYIENGIEVLKGERIIYHLSQKSGPMAASTKDKSALQSNHRQNNEPAKSN